MSGLVVGADGLARCAWGASTADYLPYHDSEWGQPLRGDDRMFERLTLEAFQSGLSWITILRKRPAFRAAFADFSIPAVADFDESDVERLLSDAGIVRNRAKIEAAIRNARASLEVAEGLSDLLWSFAPAPRTRRPKSFAEVPAVTPESTALAKAIKKRGFAFVGPTTAYALMQATGMVDDHLRGCHVEVAPMSDPVIEVSDLRRSYVSRTGIGHRSSKVVEAVRGINFTVERGELFGLLGPNGAGKTTTIKMLITLLLPTGGSARVLGHDVVKDPRAVRRQVGYVFGGDRGLYERLSALDNLRYFAELYAVPPREQKARIGELLELVGLAGRERERVEGYSRGMRQRLHIARGLIHDPQVLFLDEPSIGIDPVGARELRQTVATLVEHGTTVLLTTHYMFEADELCDRIAVIAGGEIVAEGTPAQLKAGVADGRVVEIEVFGVGRPGAGRPARAGWRDVGAGRGARPGAGADRAGRGRTSRSRRPRSAAWPGFASDGSRPVSRRWRTPTSSWSAPVRRHEDRPCGC